MRLFLLTHWSQDAYFEFKIHFLTLEDSLCFIMENASVLWLLEKITLSPYAFERYGLGSKRNGQDDWFNTCRVEQSKSEDEDQQDLYHQVKGSNQASMLLALPEAQEGQHWHLFKDGSCSTSLCKSIFALILHTEATPPLERRNNWPGEPNRPWNWSCVMIIHLPPPTPCTLLSSSCRKFLCQKFPLSDPQALELSNRLRHCNTGSLADLKMQLARRFRTSSVIPSIPSKKNLYLHFKTTHIRYHNVKPITLNVILLQWDLYAKFLSPCVVVICFWRQHTLLILFFRFHILPKHLCLLWTWHCRYWWFHRQYIWTFSCSVSYSDA